MNNNMVCVMMMVMLVKMMRQYQKKSENLMFSMRGKDYLIQLTTTKRPGQSIKHELKNFVNIFVVDNILPEGR